MRWRSNTVDNVMSMGMPQRPMSGREPGCREHYVTLRLSPRG